MLNLARTVSVDVLQLNKTCNVYSSISLHRTIGRNTGQAKSGLILSTTQAAHLQSPSYCTLYDERKKHPHLSDVSFKPLYEFPKGVFRTTVGEVFRANKQGLYKNPEFYSYHEMSYYDMHVALKRFRQPTPDSKRKNR